MRLIRQAAFVILALVIAAPAYTQKYKKDSLPKPIGYVNDFEHIFTAKQIKQLDSTIAAFEKRTTIQIALVTVDTTMTDKRNFDHYVLRLFNKWGVGQRIKNNGIVIGISKGYRVIRIENGYGIERILTDSETKRIIDSEFIPSFKKAMYFEGSVLGLHAIMKKLE